MRRIKIGDVSLASPFVLAPLAGISDASMRVLAYEEGASLCFTEMISAKGLVYKDRNTKRLFYIDKNEGPLAIQIFGREPDVMARAVSENDNLNNIIWDINMGCPVPKVVKNGEGSALLKEPKLAGKIVSAIKKVTKKPVTAKIRIGWDNQNINAKEVAKELEDCGVDAITIHGRTREQYYYGKANWEIIKEVKEHVSVPVIGNGDVFTAKDAIDMLDKTSCDMVMIARGALGNPWIFKDCNGLLKGKDINNEISKEEKINTMLRQLNMLIDMKGEHVAIREMRKVIGWYTKGLPGAAKFRNEVNKIEDLDLLVEKIKGI